MGAPEKIKSLVESFNLHIEDYKTGNKNETELRIQYLNPFFAELGWDVSSTSRLTAQIDQLVYQLYGLTEEEIKIVEQK